MHTMPRSPKKRPPPSLFKDDLAPVPPAEKPEKESDHVFDLTDALSSPFLTFCDAWADTIPERLLRIIPEARMVALRKNERLATYAECCAYIYTRTLEAPMHGEWVEIYLHVSCKTLEDWFGENHWEASGLTPRVLTEWHQHKLDDLRRHIYKKRREILKARLRANAREEKQNAPVETKKAPPSVQQSLFDL